MLAAVVVVATVVVSPYSPLAGCKAALQFVIAVVAGGHQAAPRPIAMVVAAAIADAVYCSY